MDKILALMKKHRVDCLLLDTKEQIMTSEYSEFLEFAKTILKELNRALLVEDISRGEARSAEPKIRFLESASSKEELDDRSLISEDEALNWLKN